MPDGGERLGLLGGTFDPPHIGHLVAAINVRHALGLGRVLLVVANVPWQKVGSRSVSPAEDRLAMVEAAVAGIDGLEASDLEIRRGGPSYTIDTLVDLAEADPAGERFLILGADAAAGLDTWERGELLPDLATLAQPVSLPVRPPVRAQSFRRRPPVRAQSFRRRTTATSP